MRSFRSHLQCRVEFDSSVRVNKWRKISLHSDKLVDGVRLKLLASVISLPLFNLFRHCDGWTSCSLRLSHPCRPYSKRIWLPGLSLTFYRMSSNKLVLEPQKVAWFNCFVTQKKMWLVFRFIHRVTVKKGWHFRFIGMIFEVLRGIRGIISSGKSISLKCPS